MGLSCVADATAQPRATGRRARSDNEGMPTTSPPKPPKSDAVRQAEYAARRRAAGLVRVPNLWAHADDHDAIKAYAAKLAARSRKGTTGG
jgi:hypothetical protein